MAKLQWDKATSQGGPKSPAALDKLNQERDALEKRQSKLEKARAAAVKKLVSGETREKDLEKKIADRVGSIETTKLEHSEAKTAWEKADRSVGGASGAVMRLMRMPFAVHQEFADQLSLLKENLDSLRLPETSSAQFFSDLVNDPECICGREMTAAAAAEITKRAKGYLDYEESGVINALKSDIGKYLSSGDEGDRNEEFHKSLSELSKAVREKKAAEQSLEYLTKKLIDAGDAELKSWQDELDELTQELKTIRRAFKLLLPRLKQ
jgi:DNA sulfur modification protein DndD